MILPGSTALTGALGQRTDGIVTNADLGIDADCEGLIGNFIPTAGIETQYWENQADVGACSIGNIRRFNGIGHSTTDPDHFLLDGTNDYLGKSSDNYGGSDLLALGGGSGEYGTYSLCQWFKYNNVNHHIFYVGSGVQVSSGVVAQYHAYILLEVLTSNDQCKLTVRPAYNGDASRISTATFDSFTFVDDTWYYVALTHDGADLYSVYVNGGFIGSLTSTYALAYGSENVVECGAKNIDNTKAYSGAGTKIGHVHVYNIGDVVCALTASQVRQNFLATHDMHDARLYGGTYQA